MTDSKRNDTNDKSIIDSSGNKINNKNENSVSSFNDFLSSIFNKSTLIFLLTFLGIYFVAYFILGYFFNKGADSSSFELRLSRTLDIIFLVIVLIIFGTFLFSYSDNQKQSVFEKLYNSGSNYVDQPYSAFSVGMILLIFYFVVYLFRVPMGTDTKPIFVSATESILWVLLIIILFVDFFKYVLGISLIGSLSNVKIPDTPPVVLNKPLVRPDLSVSKRAFVPEQQDEVFNVSNNLYTYDDAQAICAAYGAKIATYDQVEDAYNHGGEWCNYGWSDGQMALFPTQKATWNKLQKSKGHENDCGRPGVNGGYIQNPYVEFGVNCFGKKPKPNADDLARLTQHRQQVVPVSDADKELNAKVQFWKDNASKLLRLNSYNNTEWSEY
jgi:hypothetical protein